MKDEDPCLRLVIAQLLEYIHFVVNEFPAMLLPAQPRGADKQRLYHEAHGREVAGSFPWSARFPLPIVLAILLGTGTEEDTSEFNLDLSAIEFPGNEEQTASLESESWTIASQHEEMPGGVKGIFVHSCFVVKLFLVVYTYPIELDLFIAAHRPATVVLVQGALQRDARGSA